MEVIAVLGIFVLFIQQPETPTLSLFYHFLDRKVTEMIAMDTGRTALNLMNVEG